MALILLENLIGLVLGLIIGMFFAKNMDEDIINEQKELIRKLMETKITEFKEENGEKVFTMSKVIDQKTKQVKK